MIHRRLLRRLAVRAAAAVGVVYGAASLAFLALHLIPGDPVSAILGGVPATPATVAELHQELGYGHSFGYQYWTYLRRLASGDLGRSYQLEQPVTHVIGQQIWQTVELAAAASALALVVGVFVAVATVGRHARQLRPLASGLEVVAISTPSFWLGILLLTLFSFHLHAFPVAGNEGFRALVLPAVTLAIPIGGVVAQVLRDGLDQALEQPFALTARSRGLSEWSVRTRHALRHALLPVATIAGWIVGSLLSGTVLVETVFGRQGIGRVAATAITRDDIPVVVGVVVLSAAVYVVVNTLVDVLYLVIDPRLRTGA